MAQAADETLTRFFQKLKSRDEDERQKAARNLANYVVVQSRELSNESFSRFMNDVNKAVGELVNSQVVHEKLGGIMAIDALIDVDTEENANQITRIAHSLRVGLASRDERVLAAASKALGKLARVRSSLRHTSREHGQSAVSINVQSSMGVMVTDLIEMEIKRALEWLSDRSTGNHVLAALLILAQLAINAPTVFYSYVPQFIELILPVGLHDRDPTIRRAAKEALRACLTLIAERTDAGGTPTLAPAATSPSSSIPTSSGMTTPAVTTGANNIVPSMTAATVVSSPTSLSTSTSASASFSSLEGVLGTWSASVTLPTSPTTRPLVASGAYHIQWYQRLYDQALASAKSPNVSPEVLHGSLIALGELLRQSGPFMSDKYRTVADLIVKQLSSNNRLIKQTAIALLPALARYNKSEFTRNYLPGIMTQLIAALRRENERSLAFVAVGKIALAITEHIKEYLDQIIPLAKTSMTPRMRGQTCHEVLSCLSMLATAVGPALQPYVKDLLGPMFSVGLTPALVEALTSLTTHVPGLVFDIQLRLLDLLSQVLAQKPFTYFGLPHSVSRRLITTTLASSVAQSSAPSISVSVAGGGTETPAQDAALITLALHTLGSFGFDKYLLVEFLRDTVVHFLEHDNAAIRKVAAITCCQLMTPASGRSLPTRGHAARVFSHVLHTLLRVGITDTDATIRRTVLMSLAPCFDPFLAQCEMLRMLFAALNDEVFEIREIAVCLLSRLAPRNPAYVLPGLRKKLLELLNDVDYSSDNLIREQSAQLLGSLLGGTNASSFQLSTFLQQRPSVFDSLHSSGSSNSSPSPTPSAPRRHYASRQVATATTTTSEVGVGGPSPWALTHSPVHCKLIEPYVTEILRVLLPRVHDSDPHVAASALRALGELARQSPCSELLHRVVTRGFQLEQPHSAQSEVTDLLHLVIDTLTDYSSSLKRLVALRALALLIQSTGFVIQPLLKYPKLLEVLFNIIKTEQQPRVRREVLKLLGVLGALDPYKHRHVQLRTAKRRRLPAATSSSTSVLPSTVVASPTTSTNAGTVMDDEKATPSLFTMGSDEYYPIVAINSLLRILKDPSLSGHYQQAIQAIMFMFNALSLKMVPFLPQIMPVLMYLLRHGESGFREFLLQQLVGIVKVVKQYIRDYLGELFDFLQHSSLWSMPLLVQILALIEESALALRDEFRPYLARVVPNILSVLHGDHALPHRTPAVGTAIVKVLHTVEVLNTLLEEYLHLLLPAVVKYYDQDDSTGGDSGLLDPHVARHAIQTIGRLAAQGLPLRDYAARILQPLVRTLAASAPHPELRDACLNALCQIALALRSDYLPFVPLVRKVVRSQRISHPRYETLEEKLCNRSAELWDGDSGGIRRSSSSPLSAVRWSADESDLKSDIFEDIADETLVVSEQNDVAPGAAEGAPQDKLKINFEVLRKAWETSTRLTREDWAEWIRKFSVELLRESPSPALRSCLSVADFYPLVRELFNVGFMSCWNELPEAYQNELVRNLEAALLSPTIPSEILQCLLDLAEFMEHDEKALPIPIHTLGQLAEKCRAYAKALHYFEQEYKASARNDIHIMEALISINNKLGQRESAIGILKSAQPDIELKESWYEKLGHWDKALQRYTEKNAENPMHIDTRLGMMRCMRALGDWDGLAKMAQDTWSLPELDELTRRTIAPLAAYAAWVRGDILGMRHYLRAIPGKQHAEGAFFRAVFYVHQQQPLKAQRYIELTRELLDTELTALVGESYQRAYDVLVRLQQLTEMEEILEYQRTESVERQQQLMQIWTERLKGCERDPDIWHRLLCVRSLVVPPARDITLWLKFVALCRKSDRLLLARNTLMSLLGTSAKEMSMREEKALMQLSSPSASLSPGSGTPAAPLLLPIQHPHINFAYIKLLWAEGKRALAFQQLGQFAAQLRNDSVLQSKVAYKLGQWQLALRQEETEHKEHFHDETFVAVLKNFKAATQYDPQSYKAWHAWAMANFEIISNCEKAAAVSPKSKERIKAHLVPAVQGFVRSIALSPGANLQDTLRLLTLWFNYGADKQVELALIDGFNTLAIDTWLQVIPQLIARINSPISAVRRLLHQLLIRVGKEHPQALVFPLTVASKNQSAARTNAARLILEKMRQQASAALVDQALLVSQELIRVAILWHELWHEGLEDASRFYFGEHNVEGMFDTLAPLHQLLEKGPETQREASFQQAFGRDLQEAFEWCKKYTRSGKVNDLNRAWDLYYHAFRRLNKMLPLMKTLELKSCSPKLLEARDLELAVPGTYKAGKPVVRIAFFQPVLKIYPTKQRPRKLAIVGSDGQVYYFLLKGHEDLRQDERVMQLFGLINALFKGGGKANDTRLATRKSLANLSITRYAVIPLSPKSGLIGWVPHCDTLHELIREYRQARNILLNLEHRLMLQMSSDYDNLSLIQKVEVFEYALENTNGMDIERVLWLKSPNRETWLERRINYTRSLAVMSMVGYILGLGDRHPSNLMLDRHTGKVIHIDFGDCFEVAMQREKYPEKIPFRLTRMLINAMEVCGIEGLFRATCETVMTVLRENKESLMAVLEAFVHDPLINWWLLTTNAPPPQTRDQTRVQEEYNSHVSSKFSPRSHSQHVEKNSKQQRAGESDMFDEDNRDGADGDDIDNDTYRQDEESIKPQPDSHSQLPAQKQGHDKYLSRCPTVQPQALAQTSSNVGKKDSAERISHGQSLHSQLQDQSAATTTIVKGGTTTTESTTSSNDTDSLSLSETPTPNPQVKPHITTNVNAAATGGAAAEEGGAGEQQILNQRAVAVINRVSNKLSGRDFNTEGPISVPEQVERLIQQATSHDNLCQCYIGWCPFW